jgi:hypothetical protein
VGPAERLREPSNGGPGPANAGPLLFCFCSQQRRREGESSQLAAASDPCLKSPYFNSAACMVFEPSTVRIFARST